MGNQSLCKSCGAPILWVVSPKGARMRLDLRAPVYVANKLDVGLYRVEGWDYEEGEIRVERARDAFVSHFATCPDASKHSRTKERRQRTLEESS